MPSRVPWVLTLAMAVVPAVAQRQAPAEFEVASVRTNRLSDRIVTINVGPGGRFSVRGYTLVLLIQRAYAVMDWNVTGGPPWIRDDRFDIVAKADVPGNLTEAQLRPMLTKLLADRFQLRVHPSSKEEAGYALQVTRDGPKVTPAAVPEENRDSFRMTNNGITGQGISMRDFARFVGGKLGLVAVDETGLSGLYDFKVDWKVDRAADPGADPKEALREAAFEGLRSQLGLKIVPKRVRVEFVVIDHAERPTDN